jgi:hypothetical protein
MFDSVYTYGLHDPGGERIMLDAGRPGWVLFTEGIGHNPNDHGGRDFMPYASQDLGIICRLNNGYFPDGTIPFSSEYPNFAQRCANFVAASRGCKIWIIGNEMNYAAERPGAGGNQGMAPQGGTVTAESTPQPDQADPHLRGHPDRFNALRPETRAFGLAAAIGEVITPELYTRCYRLCRDAIRAVAGHADDQVLVGAVAPWNNQTTYPGNLSGDWIAYFRDILNRLGSNGCDGFAIHTYTHGTDPNLVESNQKMDPPFQAYHYHFRAYLDFMNAVPSSMRRLPAYLTETDQNDPWLDQNSGWVRRAYAEIERWNAATGSQQLRAVILYRYPRIDRWYIEGKGGVIADFQLAMTAGYRWRETATPPPPPPPPPPPITGALLPGDRVATNGNVNLRRTPGYVNKPAGDVLALLPGNSALTVLIGASVRQDGLTWWPLRGLIDNRVLDGWMAQQAPGGSRLFRKIENAPPIQVGETVSNITTHGINLRRTPGYVNKPASDILTQVPPRASTPVVGGPAGANNLTWWQVRYSAPAGPIDGWMAQNAPGGELFLAPARYWPGAMS